MKTKRKKKGSKLAHLEAAWAKASKSECVRFFFWIEQNRLSVNPTALEAAWMKASRRQRLAFLYSVGRSIAYIAYAAGLARRSP
jgi:hypothetical protein